MSKTYKFLLKFILSLTVDIIMVNTFFSLSLTEQLILIIAVFIFLTILEYLGCFSSFERKIKIFFANTNALLPLNEVIDHIKEYDVNQSQALNTIRISTSINSNKNVIGQTLASILEYAIGNEITIYGQKSISIPNLQPISFRDINYQPWLFQENWSDDYSSVYQRPGRDRQDLLYTNIQVKKADLQKLVQKYKSVRTRN